MNVTTWAVFNVAVSAWMVTDAYRLIPISPKGKAMVRVLRWGSLVFFGFNVTMITHLLVNC